MKVGAFFVIRVIIMDDEPLSLLNMEKKLNEFNFIKVVKVFSNATELLNDEQTLDFQVAFLDVEMPGLNGLEIAKILTTRNPNVHIVFTTAHRDYAVQAFELQSIDYLLKPISLSRLEMTIERIQERTQLKNSQLASAQPVTPSLNIQCFGGFTVYHDNKVVHWRTIKTKELFAFLFSNLHIQVHRDIILDTIWAETEYQKARVQLHTTVSYLRTTLNSLGYKNVLNYANECYILQLNDFQCDVFELGQLLKNTEELGRLDIERAEAFVQNHQGEYMETTDYPWVTTKVNIFHKQFTLLLDYLIGYYTTSQNLKKLEKTLLLSLEYNPYSDNTLQQLMRHYIETDNRTTAVRLFHTFEKNLMMELGILPDQETLDLFEDIIHE